MFSQMNENVLGYNFTKSTYSYAHRRLADEYLLIFIED